MIEVFLVLDEQNHQKLNHEDLNFAIPVSENGIYTVRTLVKRFKDDQSEKPKLEVYFWKNDSTAKGERIYFDEIPINRSENFVKYETQMEYTDSTFKELRGSIISWSNVDSNFTQHIDLKEIMIFNPQIKRDSLGLDSIVNMQRFDKGPLKELEDVHYPKPKRKLDKLKKQ